MTRVFFVMSDHDHCAFRYPWDLISPLWCSVSFSIKMRDLGKGTSKSLRVYECFVKYLGLRTRHLFYAFATQNNLQTFPYFTLRTTL